MELNLTHAASLVQLEFDQKSIIEEIWKTNLAQSQNVVAAQQQNLREVEQTNRSIIYDALGRKKEAVEVQGRLLDLRA